MAPATLTTTEQPAITTEVDADAYADVRVDGSAVASVDTRADATTVRAIDPENPEDAAEEWKFSGMDGSVETVINEPAGYADVVVNEIIVATVRFTGDSVSVSAFHPENPADAVDEYEFPVTAAGEETDA